MKIKKFIILMCVIPIILFSFCKNVLAWDLQPVADNQTNYGFSVSPSGVNTDYLLDIAYYSESNIPRLQLQMYQYGYKNIPFYYDFQFNISQDSSIIYEYYDSEINFTYEYEFERSNWHYGDLTRNINITGSSSNQNINACDNYFTRFYGSLSLSNNSYQVKRLNLYIARKRIHFYLYINQENIANIKKYYLQNGITDFNLNDYFEVFSTNLRLSCPVACSQMLVCENYIFNYEYAYSSYIANSVVYYGNYLYNSEITQTNLSRYGYGFFQSTAPIEKMNISGVSCDLEVSSNPIYPTYANNMLYYVLPGQFPSTQKYSDRMKYSTLECLYSFDYRDFNATDLEENDNIGGLYKTRNNALWQYLYNSIHD